MIDRILIIILLNLVFFFKTLRYKYASDDVPASGRPKDKNKIIHWIYVLEGRARSTPQVDHLITLIVHTLTCIFIYLGFGRNDISFLASLLFSFNPINNQVSVWIAGRAYGLSAMGMTMIMSMPILAPIILLMVTYYNVGFATSFMLLFSPYPLTALFIPLAWLFHYRRFKENVADKVRQEMFTEDRAIKWQKLVLMTKTFGFYVLHSIFPVKTSFYHSLLESMAGCRMKYAYSFCGFFWFGLASFLAMVYYMVTHPWGLASFALLWWCVGISPFLNLIRIHQELAERYTYLANVGLMYFLAMVILPYPILTAIVITLYATKLWFYMDAFIDDYFIVEYACLHSPESWFAWHVRGMKRWDAKSHQEALIMWTMARMISPQEFKVNFNIASALRLSNNPEHHKEADKYMKIAMENIPKGQEKQANELISNWHKGIIGIVL